MEITVNWKRREKTGIIDAYFYAREGTPSELYLGHLSFLPMDWSGFISFEPHFLLHEGIVKS